MLGEKQWQWLEQELKAPDDPRDSPDLIVVGTGLQVVTWGKRLGEGWQRFPAERHRLMRMLAASNSAVLLLSGDVHYAEYSRTHYCEITGSEARILPVHDVTCSGLTHSVFDQYLPESLQWLFEVVQPSTETTYERFMWINFGTITIEWDAVPVKVLVDVRDVGGNTVMELPFTLDQLKTRTVALDDKIMPSSLVLEACAAEMGRTEVDPRHFRKSANLIVGLVLLLPLAGILVAVGRCCTKPRRNRKDKRE